MSILVRKGIPDDIADIAAIHIASWRAAYRGIISDPALERLDIAEQAIQWQRSFDRRVPVRVVEVDGEVVGFASLHGNEITVLYLKPERWRQGLGARLLRHVLQELATAGAAAGWLWVLEANRAARAFYAAQGGREEDRSLVRVGDQELVQVRYVWTLRTD